MSFLFGRARIRTAVDLPKQARDHIGKLDGPNGAAKVGLFFPFARYSESMKLTSFATQAEELAKVLSQMKLILQGTQGMLAQFAATLRSSPYG